MTCSRVQKLLSAYVDRELSQNETFMVRKHLISCSECNNVLEELNELKAKFDDLDTVEPPSDLWLNVQNAIIAGELATDTDVRPGFWAGGFNFLKVIVPAAIIGIFISIPIVSNISGVSFASMFSRSQNKQQVVDTLTADIVDSSDPRIVNSIGNKLNTRLVNSSSNNNYVPTYSSGLNTIDDFYDSQGLSILDFDVEFDPFLAQLFRELGMIQSYEFSLSFTP